jgi:hypothetical protein
MAYNVYRAEYKLSFADPLMPPTPVPRTHNAIFVETDEDGGGRILQVGGSLADTNGMYFEEKQGRRFEDSENFLREHHLGYIRATDYAAVIQLMRSVPPPPRQRVYDHSIGRQGPCKPDGSKYGPGEAVPPYWKCTEWTMQHAIPRLQQSGYLLPGRVPRPQPAVQVTAASAPQIQASSSQQQTSDWTWDEARRKYYYYNYATQEYVYQD